MSDTLYCLCCGKYICKKFVLTRSIEDNERFRASHSLQPEFIVSGLLLPFILDGVEVVTEFQILNYIQRVIPDSVMPATEKIMLREIDPSTTAVLRTECDSILEAIRLLTGVVGTENMRIELNGLRRLRIERVVQIEQARARWKSHAFKELLLQASQESRICWYHKEDKSHHSNNNMDHANAVDVSRTGQRGVNSTGDTVTRTITSASDSAA
jgi:hypothetical protein